MTNKTFAILFLFCAIPIAHSVISTAIYAAELYSEQMLLDEVNEGLREVPSIDVLTTKGD